MDFYVYVYICYQQYITKYIRKYQKMIFKNGKMSHI